MEKCFIGTPEATIVESELNIVFLLKNQKEKYFNIGIIIT